MQHYQRCLELFTQTLQAEGAKAALISWDGLLKYLIKSLTRHIPNIFMLNFSNTLKYINKQML